jgi:hypothetical protein
MSSLELPPPARLGRTNSSSSTASRKEAAGGDNLSALPLLNLGRPRSNSTASTQSGVSARTVASAAEQKTENNIAKNAILANFTANLNAKAGSEEQAARQEIAEAFAPLRAALQKPLSEDTAFVTHLRLLHNNTIRECLTLAPRLQKLYDFANKIAHDNAALGRMVTLLAPEGEIYATAPPSIQLRIHLFITKATEVMRTAAAARRSSRRGSGRKTRRKLQRGGGRYEDLVFLSQIILVILTGLIAGSVTTRIERAAMGAAATAKNVGRGSARAGFSIFEGIGAETATTSMNAFNKLRYAVGPGIRALVGDEAILVPTALASMVENKDYAFSQRTLPRAESQETQQLKGIVETWHAKLDEPAEVLRAAIKDLNTNPDYRSTLEKLRKHLADAKRTLDEREDAYQTVLDVAVRPAMLSLIDKESKNPDMSALRTWSETGFAGPIPIDARALERLCVERGVTGLVKYKLFNINGTLTELYPEVNASEQLLGDVEDLIRLTSSGESRDLTGVSNSALKMLSDYFLGTKIAPVQLISAGATTVFLDLSSLPPPGRAPPSLLVEAAVEPDGTMRTIAEPPVPTLVPEALPPLLFSGTTTADSPAASEAEAAAAAVAATAKTAESDEAPLPLTQYRTIPYANPRLTEDGFAIDDSAFMASLNLTELMNATFPEGTSEVAIKSATDFVMAIFSREAMMVEEAVYAGELQGSYVTLAEKTQRIIDDKNAEVFAAFERFAADKEKSENDVKQVRLYIDLLIRNEWVPEGNAVFGALLRLARTPGAVAERQTVGDTLSTAVRVKFPQLLWHGEILREPNVAEQVSMFFSLFFTPPIHEWGVAGQSAAVLTALFTAYSLYHGGCQGRAAGTSAREGGEIATAAARAAIEAMRETAPAAIEAPAQEEGGGSLSRRRAGSEAPPLQRPHVAQMPMGLQGQFGGGMIVPQGAPYGGGGGYGGAMVPQGAAAFGGGGGYEVAMVPQGAAAFGGGGGYEVAMVPHGAAFGGRGAIVPHAAAFGGGGAMVPYGATAYGGGGAMVPYGAAAAVAGPGPTVGTLLQRAHIEQKPVAYLSTMTGAPAETYVRALELLRERTDDRVLNSLGISTPGVTTQTAHTGLRNLNAALQGRESRLRGVYTEIINGPLVQRFRNAIAPVPGMAAGGGGSRRKNRTYKKRKASRKARRIL